MPTSERSGSITVVYSLCILYSFTKRQSIIKDDFKDFKVGFKIGMSSRHKPTTIVYGSPGDSSKGKEMIVAKRNNGTIAGKTGIPSASMVEETQTKLIESKSERRRQNQYSENAMDLETVGDTIGERHLFPSANISQHMNEDSMTMDKGSTRENF